jgi:ribosomal protein S18 acetylase RimI-like enzyme
MGSLGRLAYLRPCEDDDDGFLYDVFCTTWENEVAALPNPNLARHVLRIQHIAQERRFASRYPGHQRFVVLVDGEDAGRVYVHEGLSTLHVIDLTLLPEFRSEGVGTRLVGDLLAHATEREVPVTLRLPRRNKRAGELYTSHGFRLVRVDDLDSYLEWTPPAGSSASAGSAQGDADSLADAGCV